MTSQPVTAMGGLMAYVAHAYHQAVQIISLTAQLATVTLTAVEYHWAIYTHAAHAQSRELSMRLGLDRVEA